MLALVVIHRSGKGQLHHLTCGCVIVVSSIYHGARHTLAHTRRKEVKVEQERRGVEAINQATTCIAWSNDLNGDKGK
jgi:hypothetical protein